jgi:hypothetical protein
MLQSLLVFVLGRTSFFFIFPVPQPFRVRSYPSSTSDVFHLNAESSGDESVRWLSPLFLSCVMGIMVLTTLPF